MFCTSCGKENKDYMHFCSECGADLSKQPGFKKEVKQTKIKPVETETEVQKTKVTETQKESITKIVDVSNNGHLPDLKTTNDKKSNETTNIGTFVYEPEKTQKDDKIVQTKNTTVQNNNTPTVKKNTTTTPKNNKTPISADKTPKKEVKNDEKKKKTSYVKIIIIIICIIGMATPIGLIVVPKYISNNVAKNTTEDTTVYSSSNESTSNTEKSLKWNNYTINLNGQKIDLPSNCPSFISMGAKFNDDDLKLKIGANKTQFISCTINDETFGIAVKNTSAKEQKLKNCQIIGFSQSYSAKKTNTVFYDNGIVVNQIITISSLNDLYGPSELVNENSTTGEKEYCFYQDESKINYAKIALLDNKIVKIELHKEV